MRGTQEKDDNLSLRAIAVGGASFPAGVSLSFIPRTTDVYQTPLKRREANQADADFFFFSPEFFGRELNQYTGVETLVYDNSGIKQTMAKTLTARFGLGFRNLGVKGTARACCSAADENAGSSD